MLVSDSPNNRIMKYSEKDGSIGFIKLPERCANLCFGGPMNNRLDMASCHSLYTLCVDAHGAA